MIALGIFVLLVVAWIDILIALGPRMRIAGGVCSLVLGVVFFAGTLVSSRRGRRVANVARDVDRLSRSAGQVSAGLGLTQVSVQTTPITGGLATIAVRRAQQIAERFPVGRIAPFGAAGRAFVALMAALVIVAGLALLFPRAFMIEYLRLTDPRGDHPSYSRYVFDVSPGDAQVLYGGTMDIRVAVSGAPADEVDLVVRQRSGDEQAMPMFEERDGSWRAQLTDVVAPLTYWARARRGRSYRYDVSVIYTPQIERLSVRVTPPAYTNLPPSEGAMPQGGISGLVGATVEIVAHSNRPLASGELRINPSQGTPQRLVAQPGQETPTEVRWSFPIEHPGRLALSVEDVGRERSTPEITAPILVLRDRKPFVRITSPRRESYATADLALPVTLEAEDDYGITGLSLYRSLNGSRHLPERCAVDRPAAPRQGSVVSLPLVDYGLSPGDVITLFARVEDTDPAGAKGSESGIVRITIISKELFERMVRARKTMRDFAEKYAEARRRMESLIDKARKAREAAEAESGEEISPETRAMMKELAKALQEAGVKTRERAQAARAFPDFELDKELGGRLGELADAMMAAAAAAERASEAGTPGAASEALDELLRELDAGQQQYAQNVTEPLEQFQAAFDLLVMQQRFIALYRKQQDLADRMSSLRGRDDEDDPALRARMRDLQEEQSALSGELRTITSEIRRRAQALPDDPELTTLRETAVAFADAVEASSALDMMGESRDSLESSQGTRAAAAAGEAARILKSFIEESAAGSGKSAGACELAFGPMLMKSAGMTLGQMLGGGAGGMGYGLAGIGAGADGYSMPSSGRANVGIYGPNLLPARMSSQAGDGSADQGMVFVTPGGGDMGDQIDTQDRARLTYGGAPLSGVPPQYRAHLRAYFKRVADETSRDMGPGTGP